MSRNHMASDRRRTSRAPHYADEVGRGRRRRPGLAARQPSHRSRPEPRTTRRACQPRPRRPPTNRTGEVCRRVTMSRRRVTHDRRWRPSAPRHADEVGRGRRRRPGLAARRPLAAANATGRWLLLLLLLAAGCCCYCCWPLVAAAAAGRWLLLLLLLAAGRCCCCWPLAAAAVAGRWLLLLLLAAGCCCCCCCRLLAAAAAAAAAGCCCCRRRPGLAARRPSHRA